MKLHRPVYTIDDKGRYIFLSDEQRAAKISELEGLISDNCDKA